MKKLGIVLLIGLLLAVGGIVVYKVYFSPPQPRTKISDDSAQQKNNASDTKSNISTKINKAVITLCSQDGDTKWKLKAKAIKRIEQSTRVKLEQVTAKVYKQGTQVTSLTAAKGTADLKTSFLSFQGPIRVANKQRVLKAARLNWNQAQKQLVGRGGVVLKKPNVTVKADSFAARLNLEKLTLKGSVQAIYN